MKKGRSYDRIVSAKQQIPIDQKAGDHCGCQLFYDIRKDREPGVLYHGSGLRCGAPSSEGGKRKSVYDPGILRKLTLAQHRHTGREFQGGEEDGGKKRILAGDLSDETGADRKEYYVSADAGDGLKAVHNTWIQGGEDRSRSGGFLPDAAADVRRYAIDPPEEEA